MKALLGVLVVIALIFGDAAWAADTSRAEMNAVLLETADAISKTLPRNLDKETVLVSVRADDMRLVYTAQFPNYSVAQLNVAAPTLMATMHTRARNTLCTTPETREGLELGVAFEYVYYDNANVYLGGYSVSLMDCDQAPQASK